MCMQGTKEGCVLLDRMSQVEQKVSRVEAKQWLLIGLFGILIGVLALITFKLLDSQIYLLSGERGLKVISDEAHSDLHVVRQNAE